MSELSHTYEKYTKVCFFGGNEKTNGKLIGHFHPVTFSRCGTELKHNLFDCQQG